MKKFLDKSFSISLILGCIAVLLCIPAMSNARYIVLALIAGFLGFIMSCLHIIFTQRYEGKAQSAGMMILSLFLNSVPLIYMMVEIAQHSGGR